MLMMTADELLQIRVRLLLQMAILYFDYDFKETLGVVLAHNHRRDFSWFPFRNLF